MKRASMAIVVVSMALAVLAGCSKDEDPASTVSAAVAQPVVAVASVDGADEPEVTYERERKTLTIPNRTVTRQTAKLKKGVTKVAVAGRPGLRVKVFRLTLEDGVEVDRELLSDSVRRKPVNRIVLKGTREPKPVSEPTRQCDPNYGGCVPIAYDVDCAGGSGDGPAYVSGPVQVIGSDIYDLDRDGDGWGCD
jgi:resuscitation-promoting factor RpfB